MAEKRGNFVYNDDGTVSQLVSISGSDSSVTTTDVLPMDMQARLVNTAVTHTGQVVAASGGQSAQATWQPVPDGMSEFMNNMTLDTAVTTCYLWVDWSEDGTNRSGKISSMSATIADTVKSSAQWFPVAGAFYKVVLYNGDTSPHTCSTNIKFRP